MKFVEAKASVWRQGQSMNEHIKRCAYVCYKTEENGKDADKVVESLWKKGHRSMLRHGSRYFFVKHVGKLPKWVMTFVEATAYLQCMQTGYMLWCSCNEQFWRENEKVRKALEPYEVSETEFIRLAFAHKQGEVCDMLRATVCVTTQISTTRELNRTSPNNIAEQSTRYVNFGKKGGIGICRPHWWGESFATFRDGMKQRLKRMVYYASCKVADWAYHLLLRLGMKPEDARGVLPLDTHSVAVYTYTFSEWAHIMELRMLETTGKAHPNAKLIATMMDKALRDSLNEQLTAVKDALVAELKEQQNKK